MIIKSRTYDIFNQLKKVYTPQETLDHYSDLCNQYVDKNKERYIEIYSHISTDNDRYQDSLESFLDDRDLYIKREVDGLVNRTKQIRKGK